MQKDALKPPPVRFLREGDEAIDEFGAHSRLADALASTLIVEKPLRVIGLVGLWGSGKSRVVSLVQARLKGREVRFFAFDAWLHQSDAPRRAFLEVLLQWLEGEGLGNTAKLKDHLDLLLGRAERTDSTVTPRVSLIAGLALAALLLIPLATQFLRLDWATSDALGKTNVYGLEAGIPFLIGLAVAAAPFLLLMLFNVWRGIGAAWRWVCSKFCKKEASKARGADGASAAVALFANKVSEQRVDVKTREPDPTALEFQRFLGEILEHVSQHTSDRLIFVLDNLDRLPDEEVLVLWSTIRGFFHGELSAGRTSIPRPTVILPIDETAIMRLHVDPLVADGFADKTFDVVFRVPTPVLTQWQSYLDKRIGDVFGGAVEPGWAQAAARILEEKGADGRTPRSINAFVNEIATLWLQWRAEPVSFAAMAYYAAHRRLLENPWPVLQTGPAWMAEFDPDWTLGVAALRYGAPPDVAGQILIEPAVRSAIVSCDEKAFDELSRRVGFAVVFRRLADTFRGGTAGIPLSNAAVLLRRLRAGADHNINAAWRSLHYGLVHTQTWTPQTRRDLEAVEALLSQASLPDRSGIIRAISNGVSQIAPAQLRSAGPAVFAALELAQKTGKSKRLDVPRTQVQGGASDFIDLLSVAPPNSAALPLLDPPDPSAAGEELARRAVTDPRHPAMARLMDAFAACAPASAWRSYAGQLSAQMMEVRLGRDYSLECEAFGLLWWRVPNARHLVTELVRSKEFQDGTDEAIGSARPEAAMRFMVLLAAGEPLWQTSERLRVLKADDGFVSQIEEALGYYAPEVDVTRLLEVTRDTPSALPLTAPLIAARLTRRPEELQPGAAAEHLDVLLALANEATELWPLLASRRKLWAAVRKSPDAQAALELSRLALAPADDAGDRRAIALAMAHALASLPTNDWRDAIVQGSELLEHLQQLDEVAPDLTVRGNLVRALGSLAYDVSRQGDLRLARRWWNTLQHLSGPAQRDVAGRLARWLLKSGVQNLHELIDMGGELLWQSAPFRQMPGQVVVRAVLAPMEDQDGLEWIADNGPRLAPAVSAAPATIRTRLAATITGIIESGVDDSVEAALEILRAACEQGSDNGGVVQP